MFKNDSQDSSNMNMQRICSKRGYMSLLMIHANMSEAVQEYEE